MSGGSGCSDTPAYPNRQGRRHFLIGTRLGHTVNENDYISHILDSDLSAYARLVLFIILRYRNRQTGECYPSIPTIAGAAHIGETTVKLAIRELVDFGAISVKKHRPKRTHFTCNMYCFEFDQAQYDWSNALSLDQSLDQSLDRSPHDRKPIEPIKGITNVIPKGKSEINLVVNLPPNVPWEDWERFVAHRRAKRAPIKTQDTINLLVKKLTESVDPVEMINQSIANGWTGLFPEKSGPPKKSYSDTLRNAAETAIHNLGKVSEHEIY